jgi:hypothetical protein
MAPRYWTAEEADAARDRVGGLVRRAQVAAAAVAERARVRPEQVATNGHGSGTGERAELDAVLEGLSAEGIVIKDLAQGLVDFAARSPSGREYWLCWLVGEPAVAWWHWPEDGFAGRTPLSRPPD